MKKRFAMSLAALMALAMTAASAEAKFKAGTYTASADGNNGPVEVQVVFSDEKIESVEVLSHSETAGICDSAIERIPGAIVDAQSAGVDTVSGATHTSDAIIAAVRDAIKQAGADPDALVAEEKNYEKKLTPGTYQAKAHGHHSTLTVETVVTQDAIESVNVLENGDSYGISTLAIDTVTKEIIDNQSVSVDALTGATMTSRAVLNAVEDCLTQAGGEDAVKAFAVAVPEEPASQEEHVEDYDVVVVGSGLSGISAAMAAQDKGAKVLVLEKLPYYGGTRSPSEYRRD